MNDQHPILQWSRERVLEEVRALRVAYQLKRTLRYATQRDFTVHSESVAEHKFAMFFLAEYFLPIVDPMSILEFRKLHRIILYHDFPEIPGGDIPYLWKTEADEERERKAAFEVFASLPASLRKHSLESWQAYELRESPEAKFAFALDKIEPLFELFDPVNEKTIMKLKQTLPSHRDKKVAATGSFPVMHRFVEVVTEDMHSRGLFYPG